MTWTGSTNRGRIMTSVMQPVPEVTAWDPPSRLRAGVLGLIVAEAALFAVFLVAYLFYIGKSLSGPYPREVLDAPIVTSICLWASSGTVWPATRALHGGHVRRVGVWLLLT